MLCRTTSLQVIILDQILHITVSNIIIFRDQHIAYFANWRSGHFLPTNLKTVVLDNFLMVVPDVLFFVWSKWLGVGILKVVGWSEWSEYLGGRIGQVGRDDRDLVLGMIKVINLALVFGLVRGSGGTGCSEWLGRSGGVGCWGGRVSSSGLGGQSGQGC